MSAQKGELLDGLDHTTVEPSINRIPNMNSFLSGPDSANTAVPGLMVPPEYALGPSDSQRLSKLIDKKREVDAISAGIGIEIATLLGHRECANRERLEMEAQTGARIAARQSGCFFDERGEADRQVYHGVIQA